MKKMRSFWDLGGAGRVCRFKGGGQAQTLSYEENASILENYEENCFLVGFLGSHTTSNEVRPSANPEL